MLSNKIVKKDENDALEKQSQSPDLNPTVHGRKKTMMWLMLLKAVFRTDREKGLAAVMKEIESKSSYFKIFYISAIRNSTQNSVVQNWP